jgi:serine/threonine protein phosphatase PrpC
MATNFLRENVAQLDTAESCSEMFRLMDEVIAKDSIAGETTCALAIVTPAEIFGVSVGDSGAWFIPEVGGCVDLTRAQQRKPFIGSGDAWPVLFRYPRQKGSLLLATDGLLKYTSSERIVETCRRSSDEDSASSLIQLVRYPSGSLPDDATLILITLSQGRSND